MQKILIVDDEKEIRDLIEIYLKSEGYETLKAADGEEALNILKEDLSKNNAELKLSDFLILMAGKQGLDAFENIGIAVIKTF